MPQSRKRPGHHPHQQPSAIPARVRTKGRIIWAILFALFGVMVGFFATGDQYIVLILCGLVGAAIGYIIGKNMEQDASKD